MKDGENKSNMQNNQDNEEIIAAAIELARQYDVTAPRAEILRTAEVDFVAAALRWARRISIQIEASSTEAPLLRAAIAYAMAGSFRCREHLVDVGLLVGRQFRIARAS
jgi:hypothetical protein